MALRIVFDVSHIKDFGIGTYIRNLLYALAGIDSENRYLLATDKPEVPELAGLPANFELAHYHPPGRTYLEHVSYPWFLKSLAPDLIHLPVHEMPFLTPRPYVVTVHDMSNFLFGGRSGIRENMRLYAFRRCLLRADRVLAVSEATQRDVENLLAIPARRIRRVYSAPDPRFFFNAQRDAYWERSKQRLLERYQIDYPFILYAGRIRPHKNLPRLIEAFAVVRNGLENHPVYRDLRLIIIGDEISRHPEVRRAVVQTRNQQAVRFLGFVPFETLKVFYAAASAFVFPSLYEGFGLPPLEAMATGTPVITSSVSSLPEVVGEAAVVVNPENVFDIARGIREVLVDEDLRRQLIEAGYAQARRFNWKLTAEQVLEVYRESARKR
jgi:glycosyltransferase involved in cell wall biosynthesis